MSASKSAPTARSTPKTALLLITGGNPGGEEAQLASVVVSAAQAPVAILYNIPNQPLFGDKTEDTLIAYTYEEYLKSGDVVRIEIGGIGVLENPLR